MQEVKPQYKINVHVLQFLWTVWRRQPLIVSDFFSEYSPQIATSTYDKIKIRMHINMIIKQCLCNRPPPSPIDLISIEYRYRKSLIGTGI